ncbi:50S ribosomal protein L32e [Aeropyrum pernix K1]|uniref:Large ribosomal subunit protein eL32 n=1 Tax=Aeropyrum pernix (strain ATCC 700893 / DSM 11879 / JCM 9820 / NBRC 100138 / K1) TaxID=272557 RepID=RL32_AERPE|nr:50S ribosomal protein L32e [Aeropyrum pernix]Q9YF92.1 RecName: Full=Large ribosomal subunit protein eL32; AltName: Full=50S ribosomal protein L32e [Aeropyrum pernix K1]BAA79304.1 50S ribosomal protein L32e [Aeropyrum pernix K1]
MAGGEPQSLEEAFAARRNVLAARRARERLRRLIASKSRHRFLRYLSWRFWKFERRDYWRKPKGNDNKMRLQLKGYPPIVKVGYRTPKAIRGMHPSGLEPVIVSSAKDLERLSPERHIVYIASGVGLRKKQEIRRAALERGFRVAN